MKSARANLTDLSEELLESIAMLLEASREKTAVDLALLRK